MASVYVINEQNVEKFISEKAYNSKKWGCSTSGCKSWKSIGMRYKKVASFDNFMRYCGLVANEPISVVGLSHFDVNNDDDDSASSENGILINKKNLYDSDTLL
ncbi:uncharacterized protein LOC107617289 [Arachis ipaensis]|uniref:uncharacterized protein LOC107617289 n=1 Tax=Arachis ipaensis TaxID=130454 RepID=UPI0007AF6DA8|nr:uncharacterized protein LOC107617289 [Arachis ipaensis]XP_020968074.1 uncharacterized protein LOC107617289 [Arachis ipaensis]